MDALNAEHATVERDAHGLQEARGMPDRSCCWPRRSTDRGDTGFDDDSLKYPLGRSVAKLEAAMNTPEMFGPSRIAQTRRDGSPDLMDLQGAPHPACRFGTEGPARRCSEYIFRLASPTGISAATWRSSATYLPAPHGLGRSELLLAGVNSAPKAAR